MDKVDNIRLKAFVWHYTYLAAMKIPLRSSETHTSLPKKEVKILVVFGTAVLEVVVGWCSGRRFPLLDVILDVVFVFPLGCACRCGTGRPLS